jgi:hypothetical protein
MNVFVLAHLFSQVRTAESYDVELADVFSLGVLFFTMLTGRKYIGVRVMRLLREIYFDVHFEFSFHANVFRSAFPISKALGSII